MPRLNGLQATAALRECCPGVRVLTLTRHADDGYLQQLLRAGAFSYVLKQSRASELLHAIRAVASGGKYLDPAVADRVIGDLGRRAHKVDSPADTPALSPREEEILRLVAWGYSNKEVAEVLGLSVKTVESHKTNAMHKLALHSRIDVVKYALLQGWLQTTSLHLDNRQPVTRTIAATAVGRSPPRSTASRYDQCYGCIGDWRRIIESRRV